MPKVSIIIPVFGVEECIERCARSLFNQTLDDIEYIFVDDCSTDSSIDILRNVINAFPVRVKQTRIIRHEKNLGLPYARMTGVLAATGDYIAHCDSDDWCDESMYEKLYTTAKTNNLDIVFCDYYTSDGHEKLLKSCNTPLDKQSILSNTLTQRIAVSVWNKLVKRSLYEADIIFPKYNMGEDLSLMVQLYLKANSFGYVSEPLYYYYLNMKSISKTPTFSSYERRWNDLYNNVQLIIQCLEKEDLLDTFKKEVTTLKLNSKNITLLPIVYKKKYRNTWLNVFPGLTFSEHIGVKNKIRYILVYTGLYATVFRMRRLDVKNQRLS